MQSLKVAPATQDSYYWTNALRKCWLCFCAFEYRRKGNEAVLKRPGPQRQRKLNNVATKISFKIMSGN